MVDQYLAVRNANFHVADKNGKIQKKWAEIRMDRDKAHKNRQIEYNHEKSLLRLCNVFKTLPIILKLTNSSAKIVQTCMDGYGSVQAICFQRFYAEIQKASSLQAGYGAHQRWSNRQDVRRCWVWSVDGKSWKQIRKWPWCLCFHNWTTEPSIWRWPAFTVFCPFQLLIHFRETACGAT